MKIMEQLEYYVSDEYMRRNFERWSKQYEASKTEEITPMTSLMAWLRTRMPEQKRTTVVHGDFR